MRFDGIRIQLSGSPKPPDGPGYYEEALKALGATPQWSHCPEPDLTCDGLILCGGVACNGALRERFEAVAPGNIKVFLAPRKYCTDNAAMIAIAGWFHYQNGERASLDVAPVSRLAEF